MSVDKYAHYNYIKNAPQSKEDLNTSYVSFDRVHITWFSVLFSKLYTFRNACSYYIFNDRLKTYLFKIFCTVNSVIFGSLLQYSFFRSITSYWRLFAIILSPTGYTEKFSVSFRVRPISIIFKGTNSVSTSSDYWTAKMNMFEWYQNSSGDIWSTAKQFSGPKKFFGPTPEPAKLARRKNGVSQNLNFFTFDQNWSQKMIKRAQFWATIT